MDHLDELDRLLGPVAVMDLEQRGLLPRPGFTGTSNVADGIDGRIAGAVLGMAIGAGMAHDGRRPAQVQLALEWGQSLLTEGRSAAPAFSGRLPSLVAGLRVPGEATTRTVRRLGEGALWHAAAPDSKGNGALLRAVADGLTWRDDPAWRPVSAGLGAVVSHAHPQAVAGAQVIADLVARLVADPDAFADRQALVRAVLHSDAGKDLRLKWQDKRQEVRPTVRGTLAAALWYATEHADPTRAVLEAADAPGSSDVVAGLVGAIVGAAHGVEAFPRRWRSQVEGAAELEALAARLAGTARPEDDADERRPGHIWFLIDRSGSMQAFGSAVVDGVNAFLNEQRQAGNGSTRLTLAQFDSEDPFEMIVDDCRIDRVRPWQRFQPRSTTPLYDAIGFLIDAAERSPRVEDHLVVVFTDGLENASRRWDQRGIFARISTKQAEGWTFAFLGANQDSYASGGGIGIADGNVSNFAPSPKGYRDASSSVSRAAVSWSEKSVRARRASRGDFFEGHKEAEEAMPKR